MLSAAESEYIRDQPGPLYCPHHLSVSDPADSGDHPFESGGSGDKSVSAADSAVGAGALKYGDIENICGLRKACLKKFNLPVQG